MDCGFSILFTQPFEHDGLQNPHAVMPITVPRAKEAIETLRQSWRLAYDIPTLMNKIGKATN
jgi:hypothetical protein